MAKKKEKQKEKQRLDEQTMALRVAKEFQDGMTVNLGYGIPSLCANMVPEGREVLFHTETGCLGFGPIASVEETSFHLMNASGQPITSRPGMSVFDHAESFCMIRGKHLDLCVLGGLQVSEKGDLANWVRANLEGKSVVDWVRSGGKAPTLGGAMDLGSGSNKIIVVMTHTDAKGRPKIVKECTLEITARHCVSMIITDMAVIEVTPQGLVLTEVAPGFTPADIQAVTEPKLIISHALKEMEI